MFDLFSDLSLHFERYFILNEYSIHIIQWCVLGLFVLFVTLPIWKEKRSSYVFYAGIVLRVVLLGGMTVEMIHQVLSRQYTIETFEVLTDFMQFLIYGYVLLASLYYVITLPYLKIKVCSLLLIYLYYFCLYVKQCLLCLLKAKSSFLAVIRG